MNIYDFIKTEIIEAIESVECFESFDDFATYLVEHIDSLQCCIYEGDAIDLFSRFFLFFYTRTMELIDTGEILPSKAVTPTVSNILQRFTYEILNLKSEAIEHVIESGKFSKSDQRSQLIGLVCTAINELEKVEKFENLNL